MTRRMICCESLRIYCLQVSQWLFGRLGLSLILYMVKLVGQPLGDKAWGWFHVLTLVLHIHSHLHKCLFNLLSEVMLLWFLTLPAWCQLFRWVYYLYKHSFIYLYMLHPLMCLLLLCFLLLSMKLLFHSLFFSLPLHILLVTLFPLRLYFQIFFLHKWVYF